MAQSNHVAVFSRAFLELEWDRFWLEFKASPDGQGSTLMEFPAGSQICEEITKMAIAWLKKSGRLALRGIDATPGAFETRLVIPTGINLNGINGPGGHDTALIATSEVGALPDGTGGMPTGAEIKSGIPGEPSMPVTTGGFGLTFWEPQTEKWCSLKDAHEKQIDLRDADL